MKPDGDTVENGFLLSADELEACGHFVHSPSDDFSILKKAKKNDVGGSNADGSDADDKTYKPPQKSDELDGEAPEAIYGSDGVGRKCYARLIWSQAHEWLLNIISDTMLKSLVARKKGTEMKV